MSWLFAAVLMLGTPMDDGVVLLDFQASWCAPCQQMAPAVDRLMQDGYSVRKVDIDRDRDLANRFKVENIPCFVVTVDGHEVSRVTGLTSFDNLRSLLDRASSMQATRQQKAPPDEIAAIPHEMPDDMACRLAPPVRSEVMPAIAAAPVFNAGTGSGSAATGSSAGATVTPVSYETPEAPAAGAPPAAGRTGAVNEEELISCTVRIRVNDAKGRSSGTGTIIDARRGWALVLTCGHLFRDANPESDIDIEMFQGGKVKKTKGVFRSSNLDRDLGLVSFRITETEPVRVARVATEGHDGKVDQSVAGVGCSNGNNPTVMFTRVLSKNSLVGPPNLKTAGLSVEGRSGGGLFSQDGMLLGVCNFAMPSDNAAIFAASESIRAELDRTGLSYVYKNPQGLLLSEPLPELREPLIASDYTPTMPERMPTTPAPAELMDDGPLPTSDIQPPVGMPGPVDRASLVAGQERLPMTSPDYPAPPSPGPSAGVSAGLPAGMPPAGVMPGEGSLTAEEAAALAEIRRRRAAGSEVICIVRSRTNPSAKTEIFVLDHASPTFFRHLAEETSGNNVMR